MRVAHPLPSSQHGNTSEMCGKSTRDLAWNCLKQSRPQRIRTNVQVDVGELARIVNEAWVSRCCGAEVLSAPDTEQMVIGYRCFKCDQETEPILVWVLSEPCPEHGEHLNSMPVALLLDARN